MHILCPHCQTPIPFADSPGAEDITCPSCGSSFQVRDGSTAGWAADRGRMLGRFELLGVVGQGTFGTVYQARDPQLDRVVALKVPRGANLPGRQELSRFLREARTAAQLRHPAIVPVHEVGEADGAPYLVCDLVEGVTLADWLSAHRPTPREAVGLTAALADALHFAH